LEQTIKSGLVLSEVEGIRGRGLAGLYNGRREIGPLIPPLKIRGGGGGVMNRKIKSHNSPLPSLNLKRGNIREYLRKPLGVLHIDRERLNLVGNNRHKVFVLLKSAISSIK